MPDDTLFLLVPGGRGKVWEGKGEHFSMCRIATRIGIKNESSAKMVERQSFKISLVWEEPALRKDGEMDRHQGDCVTDNAFFQPSTRSLNS